ncbi:MAG TPA: AMP-binding protein [Rectinemataceae bacterium]|nr:AMP-binding protein [Rectinemataceae bacterium]
MYKLEDYTLVGMIEKSGKRYAALPALSMLGGIRYTYDDVEKRSATVAAAISSYGIGAGDKVALLAESSPYWGVSYFGILRAGAIVVPILTDFTADQIKNIIVHSESKAVFCSDKLAQKAQSLGLPILLLDIKDGSRRSDIGEKKGAGAAPAVQASMDPAFRTASPKPDDIAMIVYTSGTTGLSKGVMLSHRNILSNAFGCRSIIVLHRTDTLLSILPLAHTYEFTIGFIIPLLSGSHIYYLDRPPSPTVLLPALKAVRPTIMLSVPLVIEKVYRSNIKPTLEGMKLYANPIFKPILIKFAGIKLMKTFGGRMRFFGVGGAPLAGDVEEFLKKAGFPYAIGYGLTESSPLLAGVPPSRTFLRSTGPALEGVSVRIANPSPGTGEGEIQAKGDNIFKGYYKDPERTRETFTEDGWFKTGDLGFIDAKKRIFVRGRIKTVILGASGENIYPEEIEAVLNQSPYVAESLVIEGEAGLTAFVYLKSEVLENLGARLQDGLDAAGDISSRMGNALTQAEKSVTKSIGQAWDDAEKTAGKLLETIRKEANAKLTSFSKIYAIKLHDGPFEKTPTQKIKRFLYSKAGEIKTKN